MIQSDITEPFDICRLGDLRRWLAAHPELDDDTEITIEGDQSCDGFPLIVAAKRSWRPNESGCMVTYGPDNVRRQVDQTVIVLRELGPDDGDDDPDG